MHKNMPGKHEKVKIRVQVTMKYNGICSIIIAS